MSSLCSNRRRRFGGRRGRTTLQCMRETRRKDVGRGGCPGWRVSGRAKKEGEELGEPGRYCAGTRHGRRRREFTVCKRASVRWRRKRLLHLYFRELRAAAAPPPQRRGAERRRGVPPIDLRRGGAGIAICTRLLRRYATEVRRWCGD